MARVTGQVSQRLSQYLIISGETREGVTANQVKLGVQITPELYMPLSWFSAAMQCVSGAELGIALAQYGGCAVLPRSLSIEDQVAIGRRIKKHKAGFNYDVTTVRPDMAIGKLMEFSRRTGYSSYPVVEGRKLVGLITEKKYHPGKDGGRKVQERMIPLPDVVRAEEGILLTEANDLLLSRGVGMLPIVDKDGNFVSAVFYEDIRKHVQFPSEFVDKNMRYRFAGAVSTFKEDLDRAKALMEAGCDILVIDTSHLKGHFGENMIRELKSRFGVPLVAGNVIDGAGFIQAAEAGADMVKVGQGPGYGCTTREVKRTGRGQATALMEVARARDEYASRTGKRVPICADGGIETAGDMNVAYAIGADALMMGKYFGEFSESAAPVVKRRVRVTVNGNDMTVTVPFKQYWGEASRRAANIERYGYTSLARFVPEGGDGLIPLRGSIHDPDDGIEIDIAFVKKTMSESGALTPQEFSTRAELELQSEGAKDEGRSKV